MGVLAVGVWDAVAVAEAEAVEAAGEAAAVEAALAADGETAAILQPLPLVFGDPLPLPLMLPLRPPPLAVTLARPLVEVVAGDLSSDRLV